MSEKIQVAIKELKRVKPLVLNLTNYVTMDFMANALLAIGAAPIMSVCDEELEELIQICQCLHINLGTLDKDFISRCDKAIAYAKEYKKPIVLDPVGAGASLIRTKTAQKLIPSCDIIKGNASEILSLFQDSGQTRGVESVHSTLQAKEQAKKIACEWKCTVVVSGAVDFVTDGYRESEINFGSPFMAAVTGMGCTLSAIIAAFRGVFPDSFDSAQLATTYFGLCGQEAEKKASGPGTFRTEFIDRLSNEN
ncbi:MAG: hydroxyethylthiazole kinase [Bdellovibrionota bacterium]